MKKNECSNVSNSREKEIEHLIDHVVKTKLEEERENMKKDMLCELELLIQNDRDSHDDSDDEEKKLSVSEHISIVRKYKPSPTLGFKSLNYDTYTLMILSDGDLNYGWFLGFIVFLFQLGLGVLTIYSQQQARESDFNDTILQIPIGTKSEVTILQLLSIFVAVYSQEDVFNAIALPIDLRLDGPHPWGEIPVNEREKESRRAWMWKVLLPNLFKCVQGFIVLFASVVVILQSTEAIELLKDFTALYVISSIDDITFSVARRGFFGAKLLQLAAEAEVTEISVDSRVNDDAENQKEIVWYRNGTFIKTTVLHIILVLSILSWLLVLIFQQRGIIAKQKYPMCENVVPSFKSKWKLLENEICDMEFNHPDCAYDGGDCSEFNQLYPGCRVDDITLLGNGKCDGPPYDSKLCRYDGNDCSIESVIKAKYPLCETVSPSFLTKWSLVENGECDMIFNVPQCGMDGGDCNNFNLFYPGCNEIPDASQIDASKIGNGECDGYPYHSKECSYDGFDCEKEVVVKEKYSLCSASVPSFATNWSLIENDTCDMIFNVPECSMDGGDCNEFNQLFPFCSTIKDSSLINIALVGNGVCDGYPYNSESCLLDGGDCRKNAIYCDSSLKGKLGDGKCDTDLNVWKCHFDRGDCSQNNDMTTIGDGICQTYFEFSLGPDYEGGDCIHPGYKGCFFTTEYPNFISEINDGKCHNTIYHNKEECGWDGGDCIEFNKKYPNCSQITKTYYGLDFIIVREKRIEVWRIGDGICDIEFNTTECGFDEGDCCEESKKDGICVHSYNTEECGWDSGDCDEINKALWLYYPDCKYGIDPQKIGNTVCDGGAYNAEECGWDDGDCIFFNMEFPNCTARYPHKLGDGFCDIDANTEECGYDASVFAKDADHKSAHQLFTNDEDSTSSSSDNDDKLSIYKKPQTPLRGGSTNVTRNDDRQLSSFVCSQWGWFCPDEPNEPEIPTSEDTDGWKDVYGDGCNWYTTYGRCDRWGHLGANTHCCMCGGSSRCKDSPNGWYDSDGPVYDCAWYAVGTRCEVYGNGYADAYGFTANIACCACGGGNDNYWRNSVRNAPANEDMIRTKYQDNMANGGSVKSLDHAKVEGAEDTKHSEETTATKNVHSTKSLDHQSTPRTKKHPLEAKEKIIHHKPIDHPKPNGKE